MKTTTISRTSIRINLVRVLLTIFALTFMMSCKDDDELILETTTLQGTWGEVEPEDQTQLVGSNHTFIFEQDRFFLKIHSWTDQLYVDEDGNSVGPDSYGYIKGKYSFDLDKVYFAGVRCLDSNYVHSAPAEVPAYNIGYSYKLKSSNTLVLNPELEFESITLIKE